MRKLFASCICFLPFLILAQECVLPNALRKMETPRAAFMHSSGASLWWDGEKAQCSIDDASLSTAPANVAAAAGIWFGTKESNGNLIVRKSEFDFRWEESSFSSGPITANFPNTDICELFNRVWEVKKADIELHLADWNDNNTIDGPLPENIKLWPGRENANIHFQWGTHLPKMKLAPFYDRNQNGLYEPELGDYPDIKGAEIAHWWMFNDAGPDAPSEAGRATTDFAVLAYSFDDASSTTTTYFYEYLLTNRTNQVFDEARLTLWIDLSLGCDKDDYLGCNPELQLAYIYNEQAFDQWCYQEDQPFDVAMPIFGIKVLDGTDQLNSENLWIDNGMYSLGMYINCSSADPPVGTCCPGFAHEYWHYMEGKWRDGIPMSTGNMGYDYPPPDTTLHIFPGDPNDSLGWSICTESLLEYPYSMMVGSGPFPLAPGESQKFAFAAIVTGAIDDYPCPSIDPLVEAADAAQDVYDNLISSIQGPSIALDLTIFPNPARDFLVVNLDQGKIEEIQIYDAQGKLIQTRSQLATQKVELPIDQLTTGLYLLLTKDQNGHIRTNKFLKL